MKKRYIWFLVIGIIILIVPTGVYLGFLIPKLKEEYIVLMASGGVVGGGGYYGVSQIPDKVKYSGLFKLSAKAFTLLTIATLVEQFLGEIIGLIIVAVISYIVFKVLLEVYRERRQEYRNAELAKEVARSVNEASE